MACVKEWSASVFTLESLRAASGGANDAQSDAKHEEGGQGVNPLRAVGVVTAQIGEEARQEDDRKSAVEIMHQLAPGPATTAEVEGETQDNLEEDDDLNDGDGAKVAAIHTHTTNGAIDAPDGD